MQTIRQPLDLRRQLDEARRLGKTVGFVPTMGALHEGHLELCRASVSENDVTAASIFVNPLQFGPHEDFSRYPRGLDRDARLLESAGAAFLLAPEAADIYPGGFQTSVIVDAVSAPLEGLHRPGHFRGVATVVLKLFNIAGPCRAYFGEKDYQQLQVIRRMVLDLDVPVEIRPVATVREADGLALSSRNRYLSVEERQAAPAIYAALQAARDAASAKLEEAGTLVELVEQRLRREPLLEIEYIALADADTLAPLAKNDRPGRLLAAVRVGSTRLIDNVPIEARSQIQSSGT